MPSFGMGRNRAEPVCGTGSSPRDAVHDASCQRAGFAERHATARRREECSKWPHAIFTRRRASPRDHFVARLESHPARSGWHADRPSVPDDRRAVGAPVVGDAKVVRALAVVDVGVVSGHGVVDRPAPSVNDDVVRSYQAIAAITHLGASPQVDSIERQSVGGLVGGAAGNRQSELACNRGAGCCRSRSGARPKSTWNSGVSQAELGLGDVHDPDVQSLGTSHPSSRRRSEILSCSEGPSSSTPEIRARASRDAATTDTVILLNGNTCVPRPAGSSRCATASRIAWRISNGPRGPDLDHCCAARSNVRASDDSSFRALPMMSMGVLGPAEAGLYASANQSIRGGCTDDLAGGRGRRRPAVPSVLDDDRERHALLGGTVRREADEPRMRLRVVDFGGAGLSCDAPRVIAQAASGSAENRVAKISSEGGGGVRREKDLRGAGSRSG